MVLELLFFLKKSKMAVMCNFGRGHYGVHLCELFFEFGSVVRKKIIFKDLFYFQLWNYDGQNNGRNYRQPKSI